MSRLNYIANAENCFFQLKQCCISNWLQWDQISLSEINKWEIYKTFQFPALQIGWVKFGQCLSCCCAAAAFLSSLRFICFISWFGLVWMMQSKHGTSEKEKLNFFLLILFWKEKSSCQNIKLQGLDCTLINSKLLTRVLCPQEGKSPLCKNSFSPWMFSIHLACFPNC